MILWQRKTLSPLANVGQPGPLPQALRGLSEASLADLPAALNPNANSALGYANTGFFPVTVADAVDPITAITRLQFVTALQNAGSYSAVAAAINALPIGDPIRIYFLNADIFVRNDPRLLAFATAMNQTPAQVDTLWLAALAVPR